MDDEAHVNDAGEQGETVLELFGIELKVKNARLAEVLTMDAREALTADVRYLSDPTAVRERSEELRQAVPDVVISTPTPRDEALKSSRSVLRNRVEMIGESLEFETSADGRWTSPTGLTLLVRLVDTRITFAAAADFIRKADVLRRKGAPVDDGVLFVCSEQSISDIFRVAIKQADMHDSVRTISLANLETLLGHMRSGHVDHRAVLALLLPVVDIDVADLLTLIASDPA